VTGVHANTMPSRAAAVTKERDKEKAIAPR